MVPDGWVKTHLKDILAEPVRNGYSPVATEKETGFWVLSLGALSDDGIKVAEIKSVEPTEKVLQSILRVGDFLVSRSNTPDKVGRSIRFKGELENCSYPDLMMRFKVDETKADPAFIEHTLKSHAIRAYFKNCAAGSSNTMVKINKGILEKTPLLVPELPEQKKVAQILSTWDQVITTTEQLLTNSQQQKKVLMQQLFTGKKRIPGFSGEFKRYHFSNLLKIDARSLGKKTPADIEFDYISLSNVETGRIGSTLGRYEFQDAPSRARRVLTEGDILLATVRPNLQGFVRIKREHSDCIASTGFAVLSPKENVCGDYIYHYLFSAHITGQINVLVVGTNYPAINSSDVAGLLIYCPEYDEQKEIAQILNNCDSTISALQQRLHCLKQEKKALMQQLLTGKRRVQPGSADSSPAHLE